MGPSEGGVTAVVRRMERVAPRLLRVWLGELGRQGWRSTGVPDEYVPVLFPPARSPSDRRIYTVASWDSAADELSLDIVDHPGGFACAWAAAATPGEHVVVGAPRATFQPPATTTHYVLVGDATALPAIRRILAHLPPGVSAYAVVEVTDASDRLALPTAATLRAEWLHAGTTATTPTGAQDHGYVPPASRLPTVVAALTASLARGPIRGEPKEHTHGTAATGTTYWWVAGEAAATRAIRRHLRQVPTIPHTHWTVFGYWRRRAEDHRRIHAGVEATAMAAVEQAIRDGRAGEELMDVYDDVLDAALGSASDTTSGTALSEPGGTPAEESTDEQPPSS